MQRHDVSGFTDVDGAADPELFVRYLDQANSFAPRRDGNRILIELLELAKGDHVLDVGCGAGNALPALAEQVGRAGRVVGADSSATMVAAARTHVASCNGPIEIVETSAYELPFADGSFTASMAARLLQHLHTPEVALREMVRVTRSGGRIAIADIDWDTVVVDSSDRKLTDKILAIAFEPIQSAAIGRSLYAMFKDAGLVDVRVIPRAVMQHDFAVAKTLLWFDFLGLEQAVRDGVLTQSELRAWIEDLEERDRTGRFCATLTAFTAIARKP